MTLALGEARARSVRGNHPVIAGMPAMTSRQAHPNPDHSWPEPDRAD